MRFMKRCAVCVLAGAVTLSLAACGKKDEYTVRNPENGVTETVQEDQVERYRENGWDVFEPGADIPPWTEPTNAPASAAPPVSTKPDEEAGHDPEPFYPEGTPSGQGSSTAAPVDQGQQQGPAEPVVSGGTAGDDEDDGFTKLADLVRMPDSSAIGILFAQPRNLLLTAWGAPTQAYSPDQAGSADVWAYQNANESVSVFVSYDSSGKVSDIAMTGNNGFVSGAVQGDTVSYWGEAGPEASQFASWAAGQTDPQPILDKIASLTRYTVRNLMNQPIGYWGDYDGGFTGDVFSVQSSDGRLLWVAVGYDTTTHVIPAYVMIAADPGNGSLPDLSYYRQGTYRP